MSARTITSFNSAHGLVVRRVRSGAAFAYPLLGFAVVDEDGSDSYIEPVVLSDEPCLVSEAAIAGESWTVTLLDHLASADELAAAYVARTRCQERGYQDQVASACFVHAPTHADLTVCLYDVTTLKPIVHLGPWIANSESSLLASDHPSP